MHISILGIGSRGDTQPYVALGLGLQAAGHTVRIVAGEEFEDFVRSYGLDYASAGINLRTFIAESMQAVLESGRNTVYAMHRVFTEGNRHAHIIQRVIEAEYERADLVICGLVALWINRYSAEVTGTQQIAAMELPVPGRTRAHPNPIFPVRPNWGGAFNNFTHTVIEQFIWEMLRPGVGPWREELGLPPLPRFGPRWDIVGGRPIPMLYMYSPSVLPRPADWRAHRHVTGYCFLDAPPDWQPPADLLDFLADGPPPVYVGFGSMSSRNPGDMAQIVLEALRRAGLRAGVPAVIVPFFGDQHFWGERVMALGVGPAMIPQRRLSVERLAYALRIATTHTPMRERAAQLGTRIRAENGVGEAVRIISALVGNMAL